MSDAVICNCCEKPTVEPIYHAEEGDAYCGECVASLLSAERDELRAEVKRLREALAKADGEVTALADALRAAGVRPVTVQSIIDGARPRISHDQ